MGYSSIAWLPLCAGLTVLGLVLTYVVGRRRGYLSMLRGAAWSLLPLAAYLTGSIEMFWKIGAAIGQFAAGFAFSTEKWAGIGVAGVAALLLLSTSGKQRRRLAKAARRATRRDSRPAAADGAGERGGELARTATLPGDASQLGQPDRPEKVPASRQPASRLAEPGKSVPGKAGKGADAGKAAGADDDMADIEEILRKRGL